MTERISLNSRNWTRISIWFGWNALKRIWFVARTDPVSGIAVDYFPERYSVSVRVSLSSFRISLTEILSESLFLETLCQVKSTSPAFWLESI